MADFFRFYAKRNRHKNNQIITIKEMNVPKKTTWVNSMFSQHPDVENSNSAKRKKHDKEISKPAKKPSRRKSDQSEEIVDLEAEQERNDSISKLQISTLLKKTTKTVGQGSDDYWVDFFAPKCSEELAIHPKKLQELEKWIQHCAVMQPKNSVKMCLLTGPSGSGKTASVRTLAKENNLSVQEWINPVDQDLIYNLGDQLHTFVSPQLEAFRNFLFKASRYRSLLEQNLSNKCLLMVEDFPNSLLKDPTLFQEILEDYVHYAKSPLIFIVTETKTKGLSISFNIFTDQIKQKFLINHISFNSIAPTLMQKSMKRFCNLMRSPTHSQYYKPPPPDILDSIVISAQGDIRNALINLHFSSLRGAPNLQTKRVLNEEETKNSKKKKAYSKLQSVGRDETITIMHALGRVFNPKYTEAKRFVHSPEELTEAFITEPKKFIDLVHANYLSHFQDVENILVAADGLSLCDVILNEYREGSLATSGLNVGIRSVMVANTDPACGWRPIKGLRRFDLNNAKSLAKECKVLPNHNNISSSLYTLDYKTFVNIISK